MSIAFPQRSSRIVWPLLLFLAMITGLTIALALASPTTAQHTHEQSVPGAPTAGTSLIFQAALSGANEVPARPTKASGYAILALSDDMATLSYRVLTADIISITAAHIHVGPPGQNGDIVIPLNVGSSGSISGTTPISPTQVAAMIAGNYYVNVHTSRFPSGEIRGQIASFTLPAAAAYSALLTGAEETPPVTTNAIGLARFTLVNTDTLQYNIVVSNSTAITLGHIHRGAVGVAGPVVHGLYNSSTPLTPTTPLIGSVELDAQGMVDLLTGYYYVNFHTAENPRGEIRGQIGGAHLFGAQLDGNQEVPPVNTLAFGRGVLALSADALSLAFRVSVDEITGITNQHIHRAPRGVSGPVDIPLPAFGAGNTISGTVPVSDVHVLRLIAGNYYINVHTQANGGGEIRGQIEPLAAPGSFNALLTGSEEVPPVTTTAAGFTRLKLHPVINVMNFYVAVTNTVDIQLAHIHKAPAGVNGGVIHNLYTGGGTFAPNQPIAGALLFDAQNLVDLLTGYYYVNVHTAANPGGEIRGQIGSARTFIASMDGVQETPVRTTNAFGVTVLGVSPDLSALYYRSSVSVLNNIVASHIHRGKPGQPGPIDFDLKNDKPFNEAQPISGTLTLSDVHVLRLVAGDYYVNVHTTVFPPGEIRGQVRPFTPDKHWNALLAGANEVPAVETEAAGVARLYLEPLSNLLHYHVAVTATADIQLAHLHKAPAGVNGPVRIDLYLGGGTFTNDRPLIGNAALGGQALVDLLTGYYYVNIHTASHPSGELRGQVGGARTYQAILNGANERPNPVTTDATGQAVLALRADVNQLSYRVLVENIENITLAHIHVGKPDQAGPVALDLKGSQPFSVDQPISGTLALSTGDLLNLAAGKFYVNVHTQANPGGEIRGQVTPYSQNDTFQVLLTETAEVAPAAVNALGVARFQLNAVPAALLQFRLDVADIQNITMAHIHKGLPGQNGPIVITLYGGGGNFSSATPLSGYATLTDQNLVDLLTGYYYVNIHTQDKPAGKIRGQIEVAGALFQSYLPVIAE